MRLTKFAHSCIRMDTGAGVLTIDPGTFSAAREALAGADACLLTHQHPDHLDVVALVAALREQPDLRVWGPDDALALVRQELEPGEAPDRLTEVGPDTHVDVAGTRVDTYGGQHALIHGLVPVVDNLGYLVGDRLYHPGDSLTVPPVEVDTLLLPTHAPWSKVAEVLDFLVAVRPAKAFQVHDALLNERGQAAVEAHVTRFAERYGSSFEHLDPGDTREL